MLPITSQYMHGYGFRPAERKMHGRVVIMTECKWVCCSNQAASPYHTILKVHFAMGKQRFNFLKKEV
jgi:hypothetical protein